MCVCVCECVCAPELCTLLEKGAHVRVVTAEELKDSTDGTVIWVDYPSLPSVIMPGGRIYIDDGLIGLKVLETGDASRHTHTHTPTHTPTHTQDRKSTRLNSSH